MDHEVAMKKIRELQAAAPPVQTERIEPINQKTVAGKLSLLEPNEEHDRRVEEWRRKKESDKRERKASKLYSDATPPKLHANKVPEITGSGPWLKAYQEIEEQLGGLFLFAVLGRRGTGKTQLVTCIIREACLKTLSAKYVTALDFFLELRANFGEGKSNELELMTRYRAYDLLVIDEAHERGHSEWEGRILTGLVDTRYYGMKGTILVSNESPEMFSRAIGPSIADRLNECGRVIEADWPSFR